MPCNLHLGMTAAHVCDVLQVLPRLIALPDTVATAAQKAVWKLQLEQLPPLPSGPALHSVDGSNSGPVLNYNKDKIYPIATGEGFPTTGAGQRSNSENAELYTFRRRFLLPLIIFVWELCSVLAAEQGHRCVEQVHGASVSALRHWEIYGSHARATNIH